MLIGWYKYKKETEATQAYETISTSNREEGG
jgi:hypothetical protein